MISCAPFVVESLGKLNLVHVIGELDIGNYAQFAEALTALAREKAGPIVVGFVECTYIDTSGLTALVQAHRALGRRLHVVVPPISNVRRMFEATGLHRALLVHNDFRVALAEASHPLVNQ